MDARPQSEAVRTRARSVGGGVEGLDKYNLNDTAYQNHYCDYDMSEHGSFKSDRSHELSTYSKAEKTIVT